MTNKVPQITLKFNPENGDMQIEGNCKPMQMVSMLEAAKHQILNDSIEEGFKKMSR
jgi:hypothetical protein